MSGEIIGNTPDFEQTGIKIPGQEAAGMMVRMENDGYLKIDPEDRAELVRLGRQKELGIEEVRDFMQPRLTETGERAFEEAVGAAEDPNDYLAILRTVSQSPKESKPLKVEKIVIVEEPRKVEFGEEPSVRINRALTERPSSLIASRIDKQLAGIVGETSTGRAFFNAWLFNPAAGVKMVGATFRAVEARAGVQERISKTTARLAEIAGEDAESEAINSQIMQLEKRYGDKIGQFCAENNFSVPPEGTPARKEVLWQMRIQDVASSEQFGEIEKAGRALIRERVAIQAATARNRMTAELLPAKIEAAKEANAAKEEEVNEVVRSIFARITSALTGGVVGIAGGAVAGIERSVRTLVKGNIKTVVPLGAGLGTFILCVGNLGFSGEVVISAFKGGAIVTVAAAVATGVGAGLVARFGKKEEKELEAATSR